MKLNHWTNLKSICLMEEKNNFFGHIEGDAVVEFATERYNESEERKWMNGLCADVYVKTDILPLAQARWNYIKENSKDVNLTKEDALNYVLEFLQNKGCKFGLAVGEYDAILSSIF